MVLIRVNPGKSVAKTFLNIQILHIQRILFDKLPPRLQVLAHQLLRMADEAQRRS